MAMNEVASHLKINKINKLYFSFEQIAIWRMFTVLHHRDSRNKIVRQEM